MLTNTNSTLTVITMLDMLQRMPITQKRGQGKRQITPEMMREAYKMRANGMRVKDIAEHFEVPTNSISYHFNKNKGHK